MQRREDRQTGKGRESETRSETEVTRYWLVSVFPKIDFIPGTRVVEEMSEAAAAGDGGAMCKDDERAQQAAQCLDVGTRVRVQGLSRSPQYNDLVGAITGEGRAAGGKWCWRRTAGRSASRERTWCPSKRRRSPEA